jgi:hypothetical protein
MKIEEIKSEAGNLFESLVFLFDQIMEQVGYEEATKIIEAAKQTSIQKLRNL